MVLDNYLVIVDDKYLKSNNREYPNMSASTLCVGCDIPVSWFCCYIKEDAVIKKDCNMICSTTVKNALTRLKEAMNKLKNVSELKSKFCGTMAEEFQETFNWLKDFSPESKVEISFGCYGDAITEEEFRNSYGIGELKPYKNLIPAEIDNKRKISDFLNGL